MTGGWWRCLFVGLLAMAACTPSAPPLPLSHEAYVWQRAWTPPLADALRDARTDFAAYRVLALHADRQGALVPIAVELPALAAAARPLVAVVRFDGFDPDFDVATLAQALRDLAARWREGGVTLAGVEVDLDSATARLTAYVARLRELRAALPRELRLSITALPAWIDAPALSDVLAEVDEAVLQVHAVQNPAHGLFDPAVAERWVRAFAARTSRPFRVALPAYGARAGFDADGKVVGVESETPRVVGGVRQQELRIAPADVARLLATLHRDVPHHLAGFVWFRLPLSDDRRAWSLATLRAVIAGDDLRPQVEVQLRRNAAQAVDLVVRNVGAIDTGLPASIHVRARDCRAADALRGYVAAPVADGWRFERTDDPVLKAAAERPIGWVNCGDVDKVEWNANP